MRVAPTESGRLSEPGLHASVGGSVSVSAETQMHVRRVKFIETSEIKSGGEAVSDARAPQRTVFARSSLPMLPRRLCNAPDLDAAPRPCFRRRAQLGSSLRRWLTWAVAHEHALFEGVVVVKGGAGRFLLEGQAC
jgi:hypothetical protein